MGKQETAIEHAPERQSRILQPIFTLPVAMTPQALDGHKNGKQSCQHHRESQGKHLLHFHIIAQRRHAHHEQAA